MAEVVSARSAARTRSRVDHRYRIADAPQEHDDMDSRRRVRDKENENDGESDVETAVLAPSSAKRTKVTAPHAAKTGIGVASTATGTPVAPVPSSATKKSASRAPGSASAQRKGTGSKTTPATTAAASSEEDDIIWFGQKASAGPLLGTPTAAAKSKSRTRTSSAVNAVEPSATSVSTSSFASAARPAPVPAAVSSLSSSSFIASSSSSTAASHVGKRGVSKPAVVAPVSAATAVESEPDRLPEPEVEPLPEPEARPKSAAPAVETDRYHGVSARQEKAERKAAKEAVRIRVERLTEECPGFAHFFTETRPDMLAADPDLRKSEVSTRICDMWEMLTEQQRRAYAALEDQDQHASASASATAISSHGSLPAPLPPPVQRPAGSAPAAAPDTPSSRSSRRLRSGTSPPSERDRRSPIRPPPVSSTLSSSSSSSSSSSGSIASKLLASASLVATPRPPGHVAATTSTSMSAASSIAPPAPIPLSSYDATRPPTFHSAPPTHSFAAHPPAHAPAHATIPSSFSMPALSSTSAPSSASSSSSTALSGAARLVASMEEQFTMEKVMRAKDEAYAALLTRFNELRTAHAANESKGADVQAALKQALKEFQDSAREKENEAKRVVDDLKAQLASALTQQLDRIKSPAASKREASELQNKEDRIMELTQQLNTQNQLIARLQTKMEEMREQSEDLRAGLAAERARALAYEEATDKVLAVYRMLTCLEVVQNRRAPELMRCRTVNTQLGKHAVFDLDIDHALAPVATGASGTGAAPAPAPAVVEYIPRKLNSNGHPYPAWVQRRVGISADKGPLLLRTLLCMVHEVPPSARGLSHGAPMYMGAGHAFQPQQQQQQQQQMPVHPGSVAYPSMQQQLQQQVQQPPPLGGFGTAAPLQSLQQPVMGWSAAASLSSVSSVYSAPGSASLSVPIPAPVPAPAPAPLSFPSSHHPGAVDSALSSATGAPGPLPPVPARAFAAGAFVPGPTAALSSSSSSASASSPPSSLAMSMAMGTAPTPSPVPGGGVAPPALSASFSRPSMGDTAVPSSSSSHNSSFSSLHLSAAVSPIPQSQ